MSQTFDNTNRGAMFVNDKGDNPNRPDRKGSLNVEGVEYWVSGWIKTSKDGNPFMSLSVERKQNQPAAQAPAQADIPDDYVF